MKGIDVGLWSPDGTAPSTPLLPRGTLVRRLTGPLRKVLADFGPIDLIHDNGIWLRHHHELAHVALQERIPRIISTRGMLEPWEFSHKRWKKWPAWNLYQKRDLKTARFHHATCDREAENVSRMGLGVAVATIPNGVDIPDERRLAESRSVVGQGAPKVALFLGRLHPIKGLPMLLDTWARVRPEGWELHIAGPDEAGHRRELEHAAAAHGLQECVAFLGAVTPDCRTRLYGSAHLSILPSYSESFGMAVVEALAHGLPVLTTTATPWPMLPKMGCGWYVFPTTDTLSEALRDATCVGDDALREMGRKGREFVAAQYSWSEVTNSMIQLYRAAIEGNIR